MNLGIATVVWMLKGATNVPVEVASVPPSSPRLGARGDGWSGWDGPLLHARLDERWH
jgi:hypothetical protein